MDVLKEPKDIYEMELHEYLWTTSGHHVIRVASGWIYYEDGRIPTNGVFVPYDNFFQRNKK